MTDIWFYQLDGRPLEKALPSLLEKSAARGWRAVVQVSGAERLDALDVALWTYDEASFLAHGTSRDADPELQPIVITDDTTNPNGASIRFLVDGAEVQPALAAEGAAYERVVLIFDGGDEQARASARRQWVDLKKAGHSVAYWQQSEDGRWEKRG